MGASWTFLTNHAHVMICLSEYADISLRKVAEKVGITERAVQRIVLDLETEGFLTREKVGRKNTYTLKKDINLRHPLESHRTIGDVIHSITD